MCNGCAHGRRKHQCPDCNNCVCIVEGCPLQSHSFVNAKALLGHMRSQHSSNPKALTKVKELALYLELQKAGIVFDYQVYVPFKACNLNPDGDYETTCAYVDFVIAKPWGYILLECDEDQHKHQPPTCDPRRDVDMAASVTLGSEHKLLVIRYNPDGYKVDGRTRITGKAERIQHLLEALDYEPAGFERLFLYFDHASGATLPDVAQHWEEGARTVSRLA